MQGRWGNDLRLLLLAAFAAYLLDFFVSFFEPLPHEIRWNGVSHELVTRPELLRDIEAAKRRGEAVAEGVDARRCTTTKCVNPHRCLLNPDSRLTVSLLPILQADGRFGIDHNLLFLRETVLRSEYFIDDMERACLLISAIDPFSRHFDDETEALIQNYTRAKVPKANTLLFNFFGTTRLNQLNGSTIVAGALFHRYDFRPQFDISIPRYRPYNIFSDRNGAFEIGRWEAAGGKRSTMRHRIGIFVPKSDLHSALKSYREFFGHAHKEKALYSGRTLCVDVAALDGMGRLPSANAPVTVREVFCSTGSGGGNVKQITYKQAVSSAFDLLFVDDGVPFFEMIAMDAFQGGATVPAIISDDYLPPFSEVIDWNEFSIVVIRALVPRLPFIVAELSTGERLSDLRAQADRIYRRYFSSVPAIVAATLCIVESRIVPGARPPTVEEWNLVADEDVESANGFCGQRSSAFAYQGGDTATPMNMDVVVTFDNADDKPEVMMERAVVELVNALLDSAFDDTFDVRAVLVAWPGRESAERELLRFDGIRRGAHPIEVVVLQLNAWESSHRFWRSEELWRVLLPLKNGEPDDSKVILALNGSNYERLAEMLRSGQAFTAYKLWRENARSAIVWDDSETTRIHSASFPAFGTATLYDVDVMKYVSEVNEDRPHGIAGHNCRSLALSRRVFSLPLPPPAPNAPTLHRFRLCDC